MSRLKFSLSLFLLAAALVPVSGCEAQVPNAEAQIAGAVSPLPEDLRAGAKVMGYTADGKLVTIREGTNEMICLADDPSRESFHAACYHVSLEPYMARGRELRAQGITGAESFEVRHREVEEGTLKMPEAPASVYNLSGDAFDPATGEVAGARRLYAVYIPYATPASTGLPDHPIGPGAPWIMRPGTPTAHLMISPPIAEN